MQSIPKKNKFLTACACVILLMTIACLLCACNDDAAVSNGADNPKYSLYLQGFFYAEDGETFYAVVGMNRTTREVVVPENNDAPPVFVQRTSYFVAADGIWFDKGTTVYGLEPSAIYSAVSAILTQEDAQYDGVTYNRLKVAFRYATIYKSIESEGILSRSGRQYLHTFYLDESSDYTEITFVRRAQNSATWYSVLASASVLFAAVAVGVCLAAKGTRWRKKKRK